MMCVIPSRRVLAKGSELFPLNPTRTVPRDTPGIGGRILELSPPYLVCLNAIFLGSQLYPFVTFRKRVLLVVCGYVCARSFLSC
jgi:hypothetical protein